MKVKQLIKKLQKLDPELLVVVSSDAEGNDYNVLTEVNFVKNERFDTFENVFVEKGEEGFESSKKAVVLYP